MPERSGINLLPDEGRDVEKQREQKNLLTSVSVIIVATVVGLWLIAWGYGFYLNSVNNSYLAKISADSATLSNLKSVEVLDRSLNTKLNRLQTLLASYPHYSTLLTNVSSFVPTGVKMNTLSYDVSGHLVIGGVATDPNTFGQFINILRDPKQGGTKFSNVDIVSLSGGGKQNQYNFSLTMLPKGGF